MLSEQTAATYKYTGNSHKQNVEPKHKTKKYLYMCCPSYVKFKKAGKCKYGISS